MHRKTFEQRKLLQILSIGEVLWDIFEQTECLGCAPLNFSANAALLGHNVALLTGLGYDTRGVKALEKIRLLNISTQFIQIISGKDTGTARISLDADGNARYVFPGSAAFECLMCDEKILSQVREFDPEWIYFGTLAQNFSGNRLLLDRIFSCASNAKGFYDVNLREGRWDMHLVERLSDLATVIKLNEEEAHKLFAATRLREAFALEDFCRYWAAHTGSCIICVTLGGRGCAILRGEEFRIVPGKRIEVVDTVGAGDAFAAAFLHGLGENWELKRIASFANQIGAEVASQVGAIPDHEMVDFFSEEP